jgi:hypothetical protein
VQVDDAGQHALEAVQHDFLQSVQRIALADLWPACEVSYTFHGAPMKSPIVPTALSIAFGMAAIGLTIAPAPIHTLWLAAFIVSAGFAVVTVSRIHPV